MKKLTLVTLAFLYIQAGIAGPKKCTGSFCNIQVSEKLIIVSKSEKDLVLKHQTLNQSVHIIADENYDYLEYKGEIMGQFSNKYIYNITTKNGHIDVTMRKKNGKFLHEYMIIENDDQIDIAEVIH